MREADTIRRDAHAVMLLANTFLGQALTAMSLMARICRRHRPPGAPMPPFLTLRVGFDIMARRHAYMRAGICRVTSLTTRADGSRLSLAAALFRCRSFRYDMRDC